MFQNYLTSRKKISSLNTNEDIKATLKSKFKEFRESGTQTFLEVICYCVIEGCINPLFSTYILQNLKLSALYSKFQEIISIIEEIIPLKEKYEMLTSYLSFDEFVNNFVEMIKSLLGINNKDYDYTKICEEANLIAFCKILGVGLRIFIPINNRLSIHQEIMKHSEIVFSILNINQKFVLLYTHEMIIAEKTKEITLIKNFRLIESENKKNPVLFLSNLLSNKSFLSQDDDQNIENIKKITKEYLKNTTKTCEKCYKTENILTLECQHSLCLSDLIKSNIKPSHECKILICCICNKENSKDFTLNLYKTYEEKCLYCTKSLLENKVYEINSNLKEYCNHFCFRCFLELSYSNECPLCLKKFSSNMKVFSI